MDEDWNDQEFEINGRQKVTLTSPLGNTKDNHKQTEMSLMTEELGQFRLQLQKCSACTRDSVEATSAKCSEWLLLSEKLEGDSDVYKYICMIACCCFFYEKCVSLYVETMLEPVECLKCNSE